MSIKGVNKDARNIFNERVDFIIEILQKKFDRQTESLSTLHAKVNYLLVFTSLLIGGYLTILFDNKIDFSCNIILRHLCILGLSGLLLTVIFLLIAARNRRFLDPPDIETIYSNKSFKIELDDLKNQVASDIKTSFNKNLPHLNSIAIWLNRAVLTFVVSLFIIVCTALFLPKCAKINYMNNDSNARKPTTSQEHKPVSSSEKPGPVPSSEKPGTEVIKGPVPSSNASGTALPFGEQSAAFIKSIR